jgi:hypothetical protein
MANVTIPDLTAITTPGATTVIEVADPAATPVSRKMTLANAIINGLEDASLVAFTTASGALSVESSVADGAGAVAFTLTSQNALSTAGSKVAILKNASSTVVRCYQNGGIVVGPNGGDYTTSLMQEQSILAYANWDSGDSFSEIGALASGGTYSATTASSIARLSAEDSLAILDVVAKNDGDSPANAQARFKATITPGDIYIGFYGADGNEDAWMWPTAFEGGGTPWNLGTAISLASGNLLDVKNGASSRFAVDFQGRMIAPSAPPANASAAGVAGSITWDSGFIYICTATNTWKRVAIATW